MTALEQLLLGPEELLAVLIVGRLSETNVTTDSASSEHGLLELVATTILLSEIRDFQLRAAGGAGDLVELELVDATCRSSEGQEQEGGSLEQHGGWEEKGNCVTTPFAS